MLVRPPAVAGRFYAGSPRRLAADVAEHLASPAPTEPTAAGRLRALVVPHAGYVYSGPTAGVGYRLLPALAPDIRRVVLLGPAHYVPVDGVAASSADAWETPLGDVEVDTEARDALFARAGARAGRGPRVAVDDTAHAPEHCLEVQIPFLQQTLPGVPVVPLLVGTGDAGAVADLLEPWWDDPETLIVVSTDLSHYEPVDVARQLDARTAAAVCRVDADAVGDRDACGARPLRAVLTLAARHGATVRLLDLRTSADTAGDPLRVVGYGAFAVEV
jgi:AmmeMemoRadiSam system protein B